MKKVILFLGLSVVVAFLVLLAMGWETREIRTELDIAAPPEQVWQALVDVDQWESWSPVIKQASGQAAPGAKLTVAMKGVDGTEGAVYHPVVTMFEKPRHFRWRAKMLAELVFTNEKWIELEKTAEGTRLIHKELFSGAMVPLMWSYCETGVPPILNAMNEGLAAKVLGR